jgi:hypothetical protein
VCTAVQLAIIIICLLLLLLLLHPQNPSNPSCSYDCEDVEGMFKQGAFSYVKLDSGW